jgi:undecaprenyl-diphosphatase
MEFIKAVILGIVEGLTEFLPISSTGHLIVASALLNFQEVPGTTFEIFIQLGAVIAVIVFYWQQLWEQVVTFHKDQKVKQLWLNILIAFIPAVILGIVYEALQLDAILFQPIVVAIALIIGGIVFLAVERSPTMQPKTTTDLMGLTPRQAMAIGVAQVTALIPGVSRSGASIIGGMLMGLDRPTATAFSFYLAIPTLGAATLFSLVRSLDEIQGDDWAYLAIGTLVAGIVSWIAIRWLLNFVSHNSFAVFGYYRILAGIVIIILIAANIL